MLYRIKEKFWSWGNDFAITDRAGKPQYRVKGAVFSWGDKLSLEDMSGNQLAQIDQQLLTFMPKYDIYVRGRLFAQVVREWSWFEKSFTLDVPGPNDYSISGSFWEHDFTFTRGGIVVVTVSKEYWSWTDSYGVDIDDDDDPVPILCACIVIDQVLHNDDDD